MSLVETLLSLLTALFLSLGFNVSDTESTNATSTVAWVVRVIDGDTIVVTLDGEEKTIRYIGIDTPEPYREGEPECGSREASKFNSQLVDGKEVRLVPDIEDQDRFGRLLRYVYIDDTFVNQRMIEAGLATPLTIRPNTTYANLFSEAAKTAKENKIGNWALCD